MAARLFVALCSVLTLAIATLIVIRVLYAPTDTGHRHVDVLLSRAQNTTLPLVHAKLSALNRLYRIGSVSPADTVVDEATPESQVLSAFYTHFITDDFDAQLALLKRLATGPPDGPRLAESVVGDAGIPDELGTAGIWKLIQLVDGTYFFTAYMYETAAEPDLARAYYHQYAALLHVLTTPADIGTTVFRIGRRLTLAQVKEEYAAYRARTGLRADQFDRVSYVNALAELILWDSHSEHALNQFKIARSLGSAALTHTDPDRDFEPGRSVAAFDVRGLADYINGEPALDMVVAYDRCLWLLNGEPVVEGGNVTSWPGDCEKLSAYRKDHFGEFLYVLARFDYLKVSSAYFSRSRDGPPQAASGLSPQAISELLSEMQDILQPLGRRAKFLYDDLLWIMRNGAICICDRARAAELNQELGRLDKSRYDYAGAIDLAALFASVPCD